MVVISGPEATAGSTFIFLKKSGITVPKKLDSAIAASIAMPIQPETRNAYDAALPVANRNSPTNPHDNAPK